MPVDVFFSSFKYWLVYAVIALNYMLNNATSLCRSNKDGTVGDKRMVISCFSTSCVVVYPLFKTLLAVYLL